MKNIYSYNDLFIYLQSKINENVPVKAASINEFLTKLLDSTVLITIVEDTAKRNKISSDEKYGGKLVYVKSPASFYMLRHDLTTWDKFTFNGLTQVEIETLLDNKVDKVSGKGLSQNDFTNALLTKLNSIQEEATKNQTDAFLKTRSNHTGKDQIEDVENLREELDAIWNKKLLVNQNNTQLDFEYKTIFVNANSIDINIILPDTVEDNSQNTLFFIKRIDNSSNTVTILPFDHDESVSSSESITTQLIEGFNSLTIQPNECFGLSSINDKWYIISKYSN